jgi:pyrimidine operon attenuation protein/uracil phosphoribosyltransferase
MANKVIYNEDDIKRTLKRLSREVVERNGGLKNVCLLGIQTNGVFIAERIKKELLLNEKINVETGSLDIAMYRDDLITGYFVPEVKESIINFSLDNKIIILCDDVLYTGRTVRAAIDAIFELGRPQKIELLVLCDRGHRELPVRADFIGKNIPTSLKEEVVVYLTEKQGIDKIELS